jgi:hypothetical protein
MISGIRLPRPGAAFLAFFRSLNPLSWHAMTHGASSLRCSEEIALRLSDARFASWIARFEGDGGF